MHVRQSAIILFVAVTVTALASNPLLRPPVDIRRLQQRMTIYPDPNGWREYPAFLDDVERATRPGDTIAIVVPGMLWENGYSYAYYRAAYLLDGREVLPLISTDNRAIQANFARAKFIAVWRSRMSGQWRLVTSGHSGVLVTR